jgi:hypothetical protein
MCMFVCVCAYQELVSPDHDVREDVSQQRLDPWHLCVQQEQHKARHQTVMRPWWSSEGP